MNQIAYRTEAEYRAGVEIVKQIGVDYEAQPAELTIITDDLTAAERKLMTIPAVDAACDLDHADRRPQFSVDELRTLGDAIDIAIDSMIHEYETNPYLGISEDTQIKRLTAAEELQDKITAAINATA